jgi:4-amino-4-deoxy-L-arabinose transferase-like glycosyltransferase
MDKAGAGCNHRWVKHAPLPAPAVALLLTLATLASRVPVLGRSVLDWDESLYFLMAQAWLHGHLPYTTIWDNKPVGIYVIFAGFQLVFGGGVVAMRLASVACVSLLAFAVFRITEVLAAERAAAWVAGGALVLCALSNDGLSANTELFMACFTALAVWAVLAGRSGWLVGVLLGCAFMVKYVAVFEAPVVLGLYLYRQRRVGAAIPVIFGAAVPLVAVVALYTAAGKLGLWWDCSVASNFRRVNVPMTAGALDYALRTELWRWGPLYLAGVAMIPWALARRRGVFLAAWLLAGLAGVVVAKSFYDHYVLQVLPVLCVSLGVWFAKLPRGVVLRAGVVIAALALPAWAANVALHDAMVPDVTAQVGADLAGQHPASLYVFDSQPILYALAGQTPPTRYVLPSELVGRTLPGVAGVDAGAEVARILAGTPQFIIRRETPSTDPAVVNPAVYAQLEQALTARYRLWRAYPGVEVYEIR